MMTLQHYIDCRKPNTYLLLNSNFINFFVFGLTMFGFVSQKATSTKIYLFSRVLFVREVFFL